MSDYNTVVQNFNANVNQALGTNADTKTYLEAMKLLASSGMSENVQFKQVMSESLNKQVDNYAQASMDISNYNKLMTSTDYINQQLTKEHSRTEGIVSELKKRLYASKQKIQNYIYLTNKLEFFLSLVFYTVILLLVLLWAVRMGVQGLFSSAAMYTVMVVSCIIYGSIMIYTIIWSSYRTKYDWTKFYWHGKLPGTGTGCPTIK